MVRVYQRRDKLPLNQCFDTAETSDGLYSEESMFPKQPVVVALGLDKKESFDTAETSDSLYSEDMFAKQPPIVMALGPDEMDKSQYPVGKIQEEQDEEAMSDKSSVSSVYTTSNSLSGEGSVEPEQDGTSLRASSGHSDETKVAVNSAPASLLKSNSDEDFDDSGSDSALWDAVVTAGIVSGSQWKEDKPFDEGSILEEGAGESVLEFQEYPNESLDEAIEITMFSDKAGRHDDTLKVAAPVKERKRRRMALLLAILCCLLLIGIAVAIGLIVGTFRNNKQTGDASNASGLQRSPEDPIGEEDEPDREEDDEELEEELTATPTTAPIPNPNLTTTPTAAQNPTTTPTAAQNSTITPTAAQNPTNAPSAAQNPTNTPSAAQNPTTTPMAAPKLSSTPTLFTSPPPSMEPSTETPVPTMAPTDLPTSSPTTLEPTASSPTSSPSSQRTPCTNQIYVDQSCYVQGQGVVTINFSQCDPQVDDWIGIYVDGANPQALGENYVNWSWACGSRICFGTAERNIFTFNSADFARQSFRAFLIRDSANGAPYESIIMSDVFTVAQTCPA